MPLAKQPPRMTILTSTPGNLGGMERLALNLTRMLLQRGWQTHCIFPSTEKNGPFLEWCQQQGIEAETTPVFLHAEEVHTWAAACRLHQALLAWRPRVISVHYPVCLSLKDLLAMRLAGVRRCFATIHCVPSWDVPRQRLMTQLASRLVTAVIVHSRQVGKALIEAGVPARKIIYFPPGLHAPESTPTRAEARTRLGIPERAFVVGTHARLIPEKGVAELMEALGRLPMGVDGPHLLVAGDGPLAQQLATLATTGLGARARLLGHLAGEALADFYASLDVFAQAPICQEALGLVYIEAAQFGVPSVSWRSGGVAEAVIDGATGLLVEQQDIGGLAEAIGRLRQDAALRERLGRAARVRAYAEFSEERMAETYAKIFRLA